MSSNQFEETTRDEIPVKFPQNEVLPSESRVATIPEVIPAISSTPSKTKTTYSIAVEDKKILSRIKLSLYAIGVLILAFIEVCIFFPGAIFPLIAFGVCAFMAASIGAALFLGSKLEISDEDGKIILDSISGSEVSHVGNLSDQLTIGSYSGGAIVFGGESFFPIRQTEIVETLTQLLPKLQASDAHRLNNKQREKLRYQLTKRKAHYDPAHIRFQVAILKALERIGVEADLPKVMEIAYPHHNVVDLIVQTAAQECLPLLQTRIANEKERTQLLRASSFTTLETDELLRPAKGSADSQPETLLRPAELKEQEDEI